MFFFLSNIKAVMGSCIEYEATASITGGGVYGLFLYSCRREWCHEMRLLCKTLVPCTLERVFV